MASQGDVNHAQFCLLYRNTWTSGNERSVSRNPGTFPSSVASANTALQMVFAEAVTGRK